MTHTAPAWSYTVSTEMRADYEALVVCCLSLPRLGIARLAEEVSELNGEGEGRRWHRTRAEEYATRLLNALRMHLPRTELIIHVEELDDTEKVRVVMSSQREADVAYGEAELADRVDAIRQRTWVAWRESLQLTMACLRRLGEPPDNRSLISCADKAA